MSDAELLDLAAKAAGLKIHSWQNGVPYVAEDGTIFTRWNPLRSEADAFWLMVKLGFCVSQWPRHTPPDVMVGYRINSDRGSNWIEDYGDDPFAATRRAIVCAAAEIGKIIPRSC